MESPPPPLQAAAPVRRSHLHLPLPPPLLSFRNNNNTTNSSSNSTGPGTTVTTATTRAAQSSDIPRPTLATATPNAKSATPTSSNNSSSNNNNNNRLYHTDPTKPQRQQGPDRVHSHDATAFPSVTSSSSVTSSITWTPQQSSRKTTLLSAGVSPLTKLPLPPPLTNSSNTTGSTTISNRNTTNTTTTTTKNNAKNNTNDTTNGIAARHNWQPPPPFVPPADDPHTNDGSSSSSSHPRLASDHVYATNQSAVVPPGWVELYDDTTRLPYYRNERDGTTTWDRPTGSGLEATVPDQHHHHHHHHPIIETTEVPVSDAMEEPPTTAEATPPRPPLSSRRGTEEEPVLPTGWKQLLDEASGLTYYLNIHDNTTTWDRPSSFGDDDDDDDMVPEETSRITENPQESVNRDNAPLIPTTATSQPPLEEPLISNETYQSTMGFIQESEQSPPPRSSFVKDATMSSLSAASNGLPDGWMMLYDETSGLPYYLNEHSGVTTWERPGDQEVIPETTTTTAGTKDEYDERTTTQQQPRSDDPNDPFFVDDTAAEPTSTAIAGEEQSEIPNDDWQPPEPEPPPEVVSTNDRFHLPEASSNVTLPRGWVELRDESSGLPYYMNETDGTTTWDPSIAPQQLPIDNLDHEATLEERDDVTDPPRIQKHNFEMDNDDDGDAKTILTSNIVTTTTNEGDLLDDMPIDTTNVTVEAEPGDAAATETAMSTTDDTNQRLPYGWIELFDQGSGLPYYMNEANGTTSWDPPPFPAVPSEDSIVPPLVEECEMTNDATTTTDLLHEETGEYDADDAPSYENTNETSVEPPLHVHETPKLALPDGWMELFDDTSGVPYFLNEIDGTTSWDPPVQLCNENDHTDWNAPNNHVSLPHLPTTMNDTAPHDTTYQSGKGRDKNIYVDNEPETTEPLPEMTEPLPPPQDETTIGHIDVSPLPTGWIVLMDETSGQPYYMNEVDGTTSWDPPLTDPVFDATDHETDKNNDAPPGTPIETNEPIRRIVVVSDDMPTNHVEATSTTHRSLDSTVATDERIDETEEHEMDAKSHLPDGWIEMYDGDSGAIYYLNEVDGTTSWDPPRNIVQTTDNDEIIHSMDYDEAKLISKPHDTSARCMNQDYDQDVDRTKDTQPSISSQTNETDDTVYNVTDDEMNNHDEAADDDDDTYNCVTVLPPGWKEVFDDASGKPYYYSEVDGTIMWARPTINNDESEMVVVTDPPSTVLNNLRQLKRFEDTSDQPSDGSTGIDIGSLRAESLEMKPRTLPSGWIELIDETNGMPYYFHEIDGVATWDYPPTTQPSNDSVANNTNENLDQQIDNIAPEDVANNNDDDTTGESTDSAPILPKGWVKLYDASDAPYYFNEKDDVVSWDLPREEKISDARGYQHDFNTFETEGFQYNPEEATEQPTTSNETKTQHTSTNDALPIEDGDQNLPIGWIKAIDDASGEEYYFCELNGETSWERPATINNERDTYRGVKLNRNGKNTIDDTDDNFNAAPETTEPRNGYHIPTGWKELVDSETGQLYYYNETTGSSTWDFPDEAVDAFHINNELRDASVNDPRNEALYSLEKSAEIPTLGHHQEIRQMKAIQSIDNMHPIGRPMSAAASFCFGGRLSQIQPIGQSGTRVLTVRRTHSVIPDELVSRIEHDKQRYGIHGPLNDANDESVLSYVKSKTFSIDDLLWCLIFTAAGSFGKLRSMAGVTDSTSPEARIIGLLLRNESHTETTNNTEFSTQETFLNGNLRKLNAVENLLLRGKKEEAVDQCLAFGNFALALIIARCCSHEVYASVVQSFADASLHECMSLRTISLLLSGQLHASGSGLKLPWRNASREVLQNTWKNHLAAILSNRTEEWSQLAVSLGDSLAEYDEVTSAHFCYMVGGSSVGSVSSKSKMVLLGCDFGPWDVVLASDESIKAFNRTEAYEWAKRRGNSQATIQSLQPLKVVYAMLLADYGFVDTAKRYVDSIFECMGVNRNELESTNWNPSSLSLSVLLSKERGIIDFLCLLDRRLNGAIPADLQQTTYDEHKDNEHDINSSFATAKTNYHDALDTTEIIECFDETPSKGHTAQPLSSYPSTPVDVNSSVDMMQTGATAMMEKPTESSDAKAILSERQLNTDGVDTSLRLKIETAPMSAPPNLQSASKKATSSSVPPSKKKGLFNLGLKDKVTKWLNPDATTADLGEKMEAHYDEKLKVWVFPGEDPAEKARPIGPPPLSVQAATENDTKERNTKIDTSSIDPLAAMMAPPRRGPTALPRSAAKNSSIMPSPSSMPIMFPLGIDSGRSVQPLNTFNIFTPPAAPTMQSNDNTGSYDEVSKEGT